MKVKELIKQLELIENKELPIFIYTTDFLFEIDFIDYNLDDRVDINTKEEKT